MTRRARPLIVLGVAGLVIHDRPEMIAGATGQGQGGQGGEEKFQRAHGSGKIRFKGSRANGASTHRSAAAHEMIAHNC